jgi:CheY-like chemotaxis protein
MKGPAHIGQLNAILLADDSEDDEILFRRAVRLSGLANPVIVVRDGDATVEYLKGEGAYADRKKYPLPKVLMLDLKMPRKNGFDVLHWVKEQPQLKEMLVVVLTSSERPEDLERSENLGADSIMAKPCQPQDLNKLAEEFPGHWIGPA